MAQPDPRAIKAEILDHLVDAAFKRLQAVIPSRRLRESLRVFYSGKGGPDGPAVAFLENPEYWAVYLHDGHGPFNASFGSKLVFFNDPNDDPRIEPIPSGYPTRISQQRRLTREQYYDGLEKNRERYRQGRDPYMWVLPSVGSFEGYHWLEGGGGFQGGGMAGFLASQAPVLEQKFDRWVRRRLAIGDERTATARLR